MSAESKGRAIAVAGLVLLLAFWVAVPGTLRPLRIVALLGLALGGLNLVVVFRPAFAGRGPLRPLVAALAFSGALAAVAALLGDAGRIWLGVLFAFASVGVYRFLARPHLREMRARALAADGEHREG